jgi:hypothetical protein
VFFLISTGKYNNRHVCSVTIVPTFKQCIVFVRNVEYVKGDFKLSTVYFAKFNINEKIYDVYDKKESLTKLLNMVYKGLNTEVELAEVSNKKDLNFKFISLHPQDSLIVNGRVVAYAPGTHISYDPDTDDVIETKDNKKATYVTFTFDIKNEIIGFVPKVDFGHNQFLRRFKALVENCVPEIGEVELFLESDLQALNEKIIKFKHVQEVSLNLIPPNNDKKLFEELFDIKPEKLNETGGNKFFLSLKGTAKQGLNLASDYMKNLIKGVSLGYGNMRITGKNTSEEDYSVKSDKDALYTRPISNNNKDNILEVEEKTKAGVKHLRELKVRIRYEQKGSKSQDI